MMMSYSKHRNALGHSRESGNLGLAKVQCLSVTGILAFAGMTWCLVGDPPMFGGK